MARKLILEADESAVFKKEFVDDDDGEEHYEDVKFEEVCKKKISVLSPRKALSLKSVMMAVVMLEGKLNAKFSYINRGVLLNFLQASASLLI